MSVAAPDFEIERLLPSDLPQNVALSRSAGWKDVDSEWRVLHAAAEVRGVRQLGRVLVQGALGDYGSAATLAKMIVSPELQRRGLGGRLLDEFLAHADSARIPVGLCATEQGRPLYASRGFEVSGELMILLGTPQAGTASTGLVVPLVNVERAVEIDRLLSGCDRSRMLRARFAEASAAVVLDGDERGFGLATQQGEHLLVGPILAESEAGARALAAALLARLPGPVRIDVPLQHASFRQWLVELGLQEVSLRVEMARGARHMPWQVPQRFALATQAWG
jgi:GNAT superfamily N-acetyltransferase